MNYLKSYPAGRTPTQIGIGIGKTYVQASSSVNAPLKTLIKDGLVIKIKRDGKVLYQPTE